MDNNLKVAVLGPLGTYTHEAAHERFGRDASYVERPTIRDVFDALSSIPLGVVPQENTIFGSVIETYDMLRIPGASFVRGEITLQVQHCLLARQGVRLDEIQTVMSHEQALGQCQRFLAAHLPSASLVKTSSTAAAAKALLDKPPNCAAICSKICLSIFQGLSMLCEGIQNESLNYTRFYIVARDRGVGVPPPWLPGPPRQALVQVSTKPSPSALPDARRQKSLDISQLVSSMNLNVTRLDRRPSTLASPFHDVYLIEVNAGGDLSPEDRIEWELEVQKALERVNRVGGNARLIGIW